MNKVAQVTLSFWIMKICATTLGATAADLLSMTMNVGYAIYTHLSHKRVALPVREASNLMYGGGRVLCCAAL